jgi:hypothetical protein
MENSNTSISETLFDCPNALDIIIMGVNNIDKKAIFFHPKCGQWSCPVCSEENKQEWVHQAGRGSQLLLDKGNFLQFVTLTGRGYFTVNSSLYFFSKNWPKFRKRLAYVTKKYQAITGTEFAYLLIPERHKSGKIHCHAIVSTPLVLERWYKDNAHQCGFGYMATVKPILDSKSASNYATKYLTKNAGDVEWPKGFMRVRHSQNWPIAHDKKDELWEWQTIGERDHWVEAGALRNQGYFVVDNVTKDS